MVYSGSIERIDFGEEHEDKGFVWAQVRKGQYHVYFVPVPARPFVTLRLDARAGDPLALLDPELEQRDITDAIVRVIITVTAEQSDLIRRAGNSRAPPGRLFGCGYYQRRNQSTPRSRDSELTESLGPLQALERYIASNPDYADRQQALLERAQGLLQEIQRGITGMIPVSLAVAKFHELWRSCAAFGFLPDQHRLHDR